MTDGRVSEDYADKDLWVVGQERKMTVSIKIEADPPQKSSKANDIWKPKKQKFEVSRISQYILESISKSTVQTSVQLQTHHTHLSVSLSHTVSLHHKRDS